MAPPPDISDKIIPESDNGLTFKSVGRRAKPQRRWSLIFGIGFIVMIIGGAGAGYFLFEGSLVEGEEFRVPLVRAEEKPIKTRPKNSGGMDVQHRDKLVYDRLPGGAERTPIEILNPPPEAPLPPPQKVVVKELTKVEPEFKVAPPAMNTLPQGPATPTINDVASIKLPLLAPISPVVDPVKSELKPRIMKRPPPPTAVEPKAAKPMIARKPKEFVLKSLEETKVMPLPAPKPVVKEKQNTLTTNFRGKFLIQLAAVRSSERATTEWSRLRRKHADLLKGLSLTITKVNLGRGKGVFFRLRAGPIVSEPTAKSLCARLSRRKIGCLVVRGG